LGWLFKTDSKSDSMEEILIFITPHILQVHDYRKDAASTGESTIIKTETGKTNK
jgi:type II secretory pathway component GspD/PulD (secretin)